MQFKLQITIDVHQVVTWPNQVPSYQYAVTIDGLGKPLTIQGSINRHGILTPMAANDNLIKDVLAIVEEVIKGSMNQAQAQVAKREGWAHPARFNTLMP